MSEENTKDDLADILKEMSGDLRTERKRREVLEHDVSEIKKMLAVTETETNGDAGNTGNTDDTDEQKMRAAVDKVTKYIEKQEAKQEAKLQKKKERCRVKSSSELEEESNRMLEGMLMGADEEEEEGV